MELRNAKQLSAVGRHLDKRRFSTKSNSSNCFYEHQKSGGAGNSEYNRMIDHVKMNFDFLHRQIEIISPDIIITGTSWNELRDGLFPNIKWTKSGYDILIGRHNNAKVIDYYHPSSRTAPAASYSLLQNIISHDNFKSL